MTVETEKPKVPKLDLKKFQAALNEKSVRDTCPMCGTNKWTYPGAPKIVGLSLPHGDIDGELYMSGMPVIHLMCQNCGFMRLHALGLYRDCFVEVDADGND
ncbi:hypothetical protein [Pseudomonas sp. B1-22]|uniref:hypothetical protein n=1 Tax=Pseudomonas sp. B1-22 TaxID=3141456 RepID=UPI003D2C3C5F